MKFSLRHVFLAIVAIKLVIVSWIFVSNVLDHRGDGPNTKRLQDILEGVNEDDPESDVGERVLDRDFRYAGCWGESDLCFPGVPMDRWVDIAESKNYWVFDGTTDYLESEYHQRLIDRAWHYAERYNLLMDRENPK